jgi:hypothetical protein
MCIEAYSMLKILNVYLQVDIVVYLNYKEWTF